MEGVQLLLLHPEISQIDCRDCLLHAYDIKTGERQLKNGKPVPRPPGVFAPCRYGEDRCPKGSPEKSRALSPKNWRAWRHYSECRAVGRFPEDSLVRHNAGLIRRIEDRIGDQTRQLLLSLLSLTRGPRDV